jgi:hypothetical protein
VAASAWAMKGFVRWAREERMRPGLTWKSSSGAIASSGNVQKSQRKQKLDIGAHIARIGRTLPGRQESPSKTIPQPSRTLPAFILPS